MTAACSLLLYLMVDCATLPTLVTFYGIAESRHRTGRQASPEVDLIGVRIDTAHSIADYVPNGLIIVKPYHNVTVRLFGTRLHELQTVRVTDSLSICSMETTIQQPIDSDSLLEVSPNTATFSFKFPHHSTTYCFCFDWRRLSGDARKGEGLFFHQGDQPFCCVETVRKSWVG